jgi:tripartite-type tricarboxylate transporter receptor subunit TctC
VVHKRTPKAIISKIHAEVVSILGQPDMLERLLGPGTDVVAGPPHALTDRMQFEKNQVSEVIRDIEARKR